MGVIDDLAQLSGGDARRVLSLQPGPDGVIDLTPEPWAQAHIVLHGLRFEKIRIGRVDVAPNFVHCQFEACEFLRTTSDERFWGANDEWTNCRFDGVQLHGMIAPGNTFRRCTFVQSKLTFFRPHNTVFEDCTFEDTIFKGFEAQGDTAFRRCAFHRPTFENGNFARTRFEACTVVAPKIINCSFDGAVAVPTPWWTPQDACPDRFPALVLAVLELVRKRLGPNHLLVPRLESFLSSYRLGLVKKEGFEKVLFAPDIPAADMRRIDKPLFRLYDEHAL